jgi:hypothetical protein
MDNVLQTEVLLNLLNTTLAKAIHFEDDALVKKINELRHAIYYSDFNYDETLDILKKINIDLNNYE